MRGRAPDRDPFLVRAPLALASAARPLLAVWGVDLPVFRALLRTRLVLDHRRPAAADDSGRGARVLAQALFLALYTVLGFGIGSAVFAFDDVRGFMSVAMTASAVLLSIPLVLDLIPSILDTTDVRVVASLPVSERAVVAARLAHVALYVVVIAAVLGVGPTVLGALRYPAWRFVPAYVACVAAMAAGTMLAVVLVYVSVLRYVNLARFRDAIVWVQCGVVVLFYGGMQVLPRVAPQLGVVDWLRDHPRVIEAWPPGWFGGAMAVALGAGRHGDVVQVGLLAATLVGVLLLLRWVTGRRVLSRLGALETAMGRVRRRRATRGLTGRVGRRIVDPGTERAGFEFALAQMASERGFRMRVIPPLAAMVFPIVGMCLGPRPFDLSAVVPYLPYLAVAATLSVLAQMAFADRVEPAWVLRGLDATERSDFARGAILAVLVRFALLPSAAILGLQLAVGEWSGLAGLLFSVAFGTVLLCGGARQAVTGIPFTRAMKRGANLDTGATLMITMLAMGMVAGVQFGLGFVPYARWIAGALGAAWALRALRSLRDDGLVVAPVAAEA